MAKNVLGRQCFKVEDGKCVLKHTHAYYYVCQHIPLVTGRKYCDFILHAVSGPDSVERIPRDKPLIKKIFCFLTALWMLVIAPEVFEMRVPRNLLPFVLDESAESLYSSKWSPSESPDCGVIPGDPTTSTSSFESVEQFAAPECTSPTATMDPVPPVACSPVSPVSYPDLCGTIESELVEESIQPSLYCQEEIDAAEALLSATSVVSSCSKRASEQGQEVTVFPWNGLTSTGISITNTCPLDNWLMIFQALTKSHKVELSNLPESAHIIGTFLKLIDDGLYADAKLLILQSLPQWQQLRGMHTLFLFFTFKNYHLMLHGLLGQLN